MQQHLGRPVVKAFNNIYADHLQNNGLPKGTPGRVSLPVAGDDATAKQKVMRLVEELGFDAVDDGTLHESWRQQPGTPCYGADLPAVELRALFANMGGASNGGAAPGIPGESGRGGAGDGGAGGEVVGGDGG